MWLYNPPVLAVTALHKAIPCTLSTVQVTVEYPPRTGSPHPTTSVCRCSHLPQGLRAALQQHFNGSQQAAIAAGMAASAQITLVQVRSPSRRSLAVLVP